MEILQKGSIESLLIPLRDRLSVLEDLADVTGLVFDTELKSDGTAVQTGVPVVLDVDHPMTAICEINTTLSGYTGEGEEYALYVRYTVGTESPKLGPVFFRVEGA